MSFSLPGLDVWLSSLRPGPCEGSAGHVHFISSCASGRITRMLLADLCAPGSVFLELASELRDLMMQNVNSIKQQRFVDEMYQSLRDLSDFGGLATAMISTFFAPTKSFTLCNAGHPPPFVYRVESADWSVLKQSSAEESTTDQAPAGVIDRGEYQHFVTALHKGDMVLSYSNALTECRDGKGQFLGVDGLLRLIQEADATRPSEIVPRLIARIKSGNPLFMAENDPAVLLCRATDRRVGWKNNMLAPIRFLRPVADNTRLK